MLWIAFVLLSLYPFLTIIYNVTFHPLADYPGPFFCRSTRLAYMYYAWRGWLHLKVMDMHERYGFVVRIAPNELSFCDPAAWEDIYSNRGDAPAFPKTAVWHAPQPGRADSLVNALNHKHHAKMRKKMEPGFTDNAVAKQEHIVRRYVDLFMSRLKESSRKKATVDVAKWLTFMAVDIMADLSFGEPFNCLEKEELGEWAGLVFNTIKLSFHMATLRHYTWTTSILNRLVPKSEKQKADWMWRIVRYKVDQRLAESTERSDFLSLWREQEKGGGGLAMDEVYANALVMIVAGSETITSLLSGILNHLVTSSDKLDVLAAEIRERFKSEDQITFMAVKDLPYLNAVIQEGFRMCNPNPFGLPRVTPTCGGIVCGKRIPGNILVQVHPQALSMNESRFHEVAMFHPERWLPKTMDDPLSPFYSDDRDCVQAFSIGPRSCLGKRLALAEMRLILTRLVWAFDIQRSDAEAGVLEWEKQRAIPVIERKAFEIRLDLREG